jgi:hypothetical protein
MPLLCLALPPFCCFVGPFLAAHLTMSEAKSRSGSGLNDILTDKGANPDRYILDASEEAVDFKNVILDAAAHLLENWALTDRITSRDSWPCEGMVVALGDASTFGGKNSRAQRQKSMNVSVQRLQRWLRYLPATDEQIVAIGGHLAYLVDAFEEGTLEWDGDKDTDVNKATLTKRLKSELVDLIPKCNDADILLLHFDDGDGNSMWSKRLVKDQKRSPYSQKIPLFLGDIDDGAQSTDEGGTDEIFLALALQIALKMAARSVAHLHPRIHARKRPRLHAATNTPHTHTPAPCTRAHKHTHTHAHTRTHTHTHTRTHTHKTHCRAALLGQIFSRIGPKNLRDRPRGCIPRF